MQLLIPTSLRAWADAALSLVYPDVCQVCEAERAGAKQAFVCDSCRAKVTLIKPPTCNRCGLPFKGDITVEFTCDHCRELDFQFCWARAAAAARGPVLDAIHKYKYNGKTWFEAFLGELLIDAAAEPLGAENWNALIPVPLFPVRQREREFNQAERLARRLAEATHIPVQARLLRRVVPTQSQTRLSRRERAENMRNAFAIRGKPDLTGQSFVLIDDVFTTGATTNACAKVLLKAGASHVAVWTVARGV